MNRTLRKNAFASGAIASLLVANITAGQALPPEAISREVSLFNFGMASVAVEAISRELSLFNLGVPSANQEAISREISLFNLGAPSAEIEAISRELSIFNLGEPSALVEAISREVSIFNIGEPSAPIEAISREVSVHNLGLETAFFEAISREVSVFNHGLPTADVEANSREVSVFNFGQPPSPEEAISREVSVFAYTNTSGAPAFVFHPEDQNVLAGGTAPFYALASGEEPMSYQWFFNAVAIPGATAAPLVVAAAQDVAAGNYYVVAQNEFGAATSHVATLTVLEPPIITESPHDQFLLEGAVGMFRGSFSGTGPFTVRWLRNGIEVLSQTNVVTTNSTFSVPNVTIEMHGHRFEMIVANGAWPGGVISAPAFLWVEQAASILSQPASASVTLGTNVIFCVSASGSQPLRYQWRHNGANVPGATNSCLIITNVQLSDGGTYTVAIENGFSAVVSAPALLRISAPLAPPGDNFSARADLGNSASGLVSGTNDFATKQLGEPDHAGKPGGRSVWYAWTAPTNGIATFRTAGSAFDTLLGIYTGTNVENLTMVAGDEDSGGSFTSEARFRVVTGNVYAIAVDGFGGASGRYLLSWEVEATADELPVITAHPASQTVGSNAPAMFSASASGSGLRFQWFFNDGPLPGETNSVLNIANVKPDDVGLYRATVTNVSGRGAESRVATLEIGPQSGAQTQDKFEDLFAGGPGFGAPGVRASLSGGTLTVSAGLPLTMFLNNTNATTQQGEPTECRIGGASRWINLRVDSEGVCVLDTQGSGIDTVLAVYTGPNPLALAPVVYEGMTACNDNAATNVTWSRVRFLAQIGIEYRVQVDGANGQSGLIALNAAIGHPPSFPPQTTNSLVAVGDAIVLESGVTNAADYGLQWLWNGREIAGATNATLLIPNALAASGGDYSVIIRNRFGTITRLIATIQVEVPYLTPLGLNPGQQRLQLLVQRPANQSLVLEGSADFRVWRALHTIPLTIPGPMIELPWTNGIQFYRARPWP